MNNAQHMLSHAATLKKRCGELWYFHRLGLVSRAESEQITNKHGLAYNCAFNVHDVEVREQNASYKNARY
jgi:hypothetical protein